MIQIEVDADAALAGHLDRRRREAGSPHVLDADDRVLGHELEAGFDQELFGERVADLNGGALFVGTVVEFADAMVAPWMPSRPVLEPT